MMVTTEWQFAGIDGRPVGLKASGVRDRLELLGEAITPEEFRGITIMERAALSTWALGRQS